jgi:hypothetical protein
MHQSSYLLNLHNLGSFFAVNPPQRGFIERGFYYKLLNNRVIIYMEKKLLSAEKIRCRSFYYILLYILLYIQPE